MENNAVNTVQELLNTGLVNQNTTSILQNLLGQQDEIAPSFFDVASFDILKAVSTLLIPQTDRLYKIDLASMLDKQLAANKETDWQHGNTPPDNQKLISGLKGIDETSEAMFGDNFTDLDDAEQDSVLIAIEKGVAQGKTWETIASKSFFEALLAKLTGLYNSYQ